MQEMRKDTGMYSKYK